MKYLKILYGLFILSLLLFLASCAYERRMEAERQFGTVVKIEPIRRYGEDGLKIITWEMDRGAGYFEIVSKSCEVTIGQRMLFLTKR